MQPDEDPEDPVGHLIACVAGRKEGALERLVDRTHLRVQRIVMARLGGPDAVETVVAEVYAQVWRIASRFDERIGSGMTWLAVIARSRSIDHLRRKQVRREENHDPWTMEEVPFEGPSPLEDSLTTERSQAIHQALAKLTSDQRNAIRAAFFEGLTHKEVALALDQPLGTIKTRIRSGLSVLRETLLPTLGSSAP